MPKAPRKASAKPTANTTPDALQMPSEGRNAPFPWTADHIANLQGLDSTDLPVKDIVEALNERFPDMTFTRENVLKMRKKLKEDPTGNHMVPNRNNDLTTEARVDLLHWANEGWKYKDIGDKLTAKYGIVKGDTAISDMLKRMGFPGIKTYVRPWGDDMNRELVLLCGEKPILNQGQMARRLEARFGVPFQAKMVLEQMMRLKARGQL